MKNNSLKKFYKENGYFIYKINKKVIINLRKEFISIFNLISKGNIRKKIKNDNDIIKLYKSKNRNLWTSVYDIIKLHPGIFAISNQKHLEKILFCASLFDLSSRFSNEKSYEKYKYLNSFLDRVLNKNYDYFPPLNLVQRNKKFYRL